MQAVCHHSYTNCDDLHCQVRIFAIHMLQSQGQAQKNSFWKLTLSSSPTPIVTVKNESSQTLLRYPIGSKQGSARDSSSNLIGGN